MLSDSSLKETSNLDFYRFFHLLKNHTFHNTTTTFNVSLTSAIRPGTWSFEAFSSWAWFPSSWCTSCWGTLPAPSGPESSPHSVCVGIPWRQYCPTHSHSHMRATSHSSQGRGPVPNWCRSKRRFCAGAFDCDCTRWSFQPLPFASRPYAGERRLVSEWRHEIPKRTRKNTECGCQ